MALILKAHSRLATGGAADAASSAEPAACSSATATAATPASVDASVSSMIAFVKTEYLYVLFVLCNVIVYSNPFL
jgi:hypothetical protein